VTDPDLATLYRHATAVVQPSLYEGFGLPLAEALAAGGRVLCSDIPAFREVCGPWATYFDPADVDGLAGLLRASLDYPTTDTSGARAWASQFSWTTAARQLVSLYEQLAITV
jgi:glycosyltransferase involved in cell wall biosynthesis